MPDSCPIFPAVAAATQDGLPWNQRSKRDAMPEDETGLPPGFTPPRTWLLMGHRAGDNSQVQALAEALGWPYEVRRFVYRPTELLTNLTVPKTLAGIVRAKSSKLEPPWPDLIISAGRRNEPVCRWIQRQAKGQRVRLVHCGRPWARILNFDLVVTTPQYRLPQRPQVLHNATPLHRVTEGRLEAEGALWRDRLAQLPQPYVSVIIGGNSGPFSFDQRGAARLGLQASALAKKLGGSLLITTSARTPPATIGVLEDSIDVPSYLFRWRKDAEENPYFAFLDLAERHIVTGDSMSMLTEACATRKRVYIFDLGEGHLAMRAGAPPVKRPLIPEADNIRGFWYRQMMKYGPQRLSRDIRLIHARLVEEGRCAWLGVDDLEDWQEPPPLDAVPRAVARVRQLFAAEGQTGAEPTATEEALAGGR